MIDVEPVIRFSKLRNVPRRTFPMHLLSFLFTAVAVLPLAANDSVVWPSEWNVFLPLTKESPVLPPETLASIPDRIEVDGRILESRTARPEPDGSFDFAPLFEEAATGNAAYIFAPLEAGQAGPVTIGFGADWWLQAWLNGEEVFNTLEEGNLRWPPSTGDHTMEIDLREGRNVLAVRFIRGSASAGFAMGGSEQIAAVPRPDYAIVQDPFRGMNSLAERQGIKPYDLFWRENGLMTPRVIFHDLDYGTEIWMLDDSPTVDEVLTASVWPAWNINASRLWLRGVRPDAQGRNWSRWIFNGDFSRLNRAPAAYSTPIWDPADPDILYYHQDHGDEPSALYRMNLRLGQNETVSTWHPSVRAERIYGFTRDERYLFLDTPNGGLWLPYEPGEEEIPELRLYDGRPGGPPWPEGVPTRHGELFELSNVRRNPAVHTEQWGHLIRVRVGKKIDPETGEMKAVIAPASGNRIYLENYKSGRVEFPEGSEWEDFDILMSDDLQELVEMYRYFPMMTHGHESRSPDYQFFVRDAGTDLITEFDYEVIGEYDFRSYHMHWILHPRFFVSWTRGWIFGSFTKPEQANIIHQAFSDLTSQPILNTKHLLNGFYGGADFTMLSPDVTKIHFGSSMTGRLRNYVGVMARPRPPQSVDWKALEQGVRLSWQPSVFSAETRGYFVHRSDRSGAGYELLTPEPVEATEWLDATVEPGKPYYYVVTSIEHSGLESGYSEEAARAGLQLEDATGDPLVIYTEAEHSIRDLPTAARPGLAMGVDRWQASDWYYVYRHPEAETGQATVPVRIPAKARYSVWARVSSGDGQDASWKINLGDAQLEVVTDQSDWTWVRAGEVELEPGKTELLISTGHAAARIDLHCLATDPEFVPEGPRPETRHVPSPVRELSAHNVRPRVNHLQWAPSQDPAFSHYNMHASRSGPLEEVSQETLIGSTTDPEFIDWGLRADTEYHYAVTVVNRSREESAPARAQARIPEREQPEVRLELAFAQAKWTGPYEDGQAGGLRAEAYAVPGKPAENRLEWEVEIPQEDEYFLWLRHLQRGTGARGGNVNQNVEVLLNGERIARLGGGWTDLTAPDDLIEEGNPLAEHLWTWAWPGEGNLEGVRLPAGKHTLTLRNLAEEVRYDVLLLTNEPSFLPGDGRLRQP